MGDKDPKHFKDTCLSVANKINPLKSKFIGANQATFINKEIQQTVMDRSKLRKKVLKNTFVSDKRAYSKQRNKYVCLLRKNKKA